MFSLLGGSSFSGQKQASPPSCHDRQEVARAVPQTFLTFSELLLLVISVTPLCLSSLHRHLGFLQCVVVAFSRTKGAPASAWRPQLHPASTTSSCQCHRLSSTRDPAMRFTMDRWQQRITDSYLRMALLKAVQARTNSRPARTTFRMSLNTLSDSHLLPEVQAKQTYNNHRRRQIRAAFLNLRCPILSEAACLVVQQINRGKRTHRRLRNCNTPIKLQRRAMSHISQKRLDLRAERSSADCLQMCLRS